MPFIELFYRNTRNIFLIILTLLLNALVLFYFQVPREVRYVYNNYNNRPAGAYIFVASVSPIFQYNMYLRMVRACIYTQVLQIILGPACGFAVGGVKICITNFLATLVLSTAKMMDHHKISRSGTLTT